MFGFEKNLDSFRNEFGSVWKMQFIQDIIVIYYILCNSREVNLEQMLQPYCYVE